jgi:spore coat polysaccharide biosynthesis protein SpsF
MSSSRLPGKVLMDIAGKPMLGRVVERAAKAETVQGVIVATTSEPEDDPVASFCERSGISCYRGSLHDVLDRYYGAARQFLVDTIVRLTADCPLMDPAVIDDTVDAFSGSPAYDFAANRLPPPWKRTYPIGLDVEVCSFEALERAWKEARQPFEREHVMPYLYNAEGRFRVKVIDHDPDYGSLRWTVDTAEDLELVRQVYARFEGRDFFGWKEVLALFEREPWLAQINARVKHRTAYDFEKPAE